MSSPSVSLPCRVFALSITVPCLRPQHHCAVSSPSVSLCRVFALNITVPCLLYAVSSPSTSTLPSSSPISITLPCRLRITSCIRPHHHFAVSSPSASYRRVFVLNITLPCLRPQHHTAVSSPSDITVPCLRRQHHSAVYSLSTSHPPCLRRRHHTAAIARAAAAASSCTHRSLLFIIARGDGMVQWSALFLLPGSSCLEPTPCFCPSFYFCHLKK